MILALIDENTGETIKVYGKNTTLEITDSYFSECSKLMSKQRKKSVIDRNNELRYFANLDEIIKMGFIQRSEIETIIERKLIEIENRVTLKLKFEYYVSRPIKKAFMKGLTFFGFKIMKNLQNAGI
jgi:hypothetical protein